MVEDTTTKANMESSVIKGLQHLNFGDVRDVAALQNMISSKEFSPLFIKVVSALILELVGAYNLEETVSGDKESFGLEVKGALRELQCPYSEIMENDGLNTIKGRIFVLDYLISEVEASRIISSKAGSNGNDEPMEVDNPVSNSILMITQTLKLPKIPDLSKTFVDIQNKLQKLLASLPSGYIKEPLLGKPLDAKQWKQASLINDALCQEYKMRRQVLIKRLDVTIQSFSWSDRTMKMAFDISKVFERIRKQLSADSLTSLVDVLAARKDLCIIEKTCYGDARDVTKCAINKHMIGKVPDRGGRPSSVPPPPEMPSFQQRKTDGGRGGGRGGFQGGGRGGFQGGGGRGGGGYQGGRGGGGFQGGGGGGYQSGGYGRGGGGGGWRGGGGSSRDRSFNRGDQKQYFS